MSIVLKNISKSYKDDKVLHDVNLDIETGETMVLFGPSGSGKTVLLRLIAGVVEPDAGQILINGHDMAGVNPEDRDIGMAFQNFALFPHMDAYENIASPLEAQRKSKATIKETVDKVAKLLKIDHVLDHQPKALSNGQKQRTALARALSGEPSILLLDDPLRNVDAKLRFEMRLELPRLLARQKATVIYVTQDYKEAMALGTRIAVLDHGSIEQVGTPEDIYLRPNNIEIARLFGDPVINLLDVVPEMGKNGAVVRLSDAEFPLPKGYDSVVGKPCVLGLRPEILTLHKEKVANSFPVTIATETPLNEKTVTLAVTKRGRELMISRPSTNQAPDSGQAYITAEISHALLFEKEKSTRIAPETVSKKVEKTA